MEFTIKYGIYLKILNLPLSMEITIKYGLTINFGIYH